MVLNSRPAGVAAVGLLLAGWVAAVAIRGTILHGANLESAGTQATSAPPVQAVSADTCLTCHDKATETRLHEYHRDCQSCHSGGAVHVEAPEKGNISRPAAAECLTCHGSAMKGTWSFGHHAKAAVACSSCHTIHVSRAPTGLEGRGKRIDPTSETCAACHTDVMARFRLPSHHPVTEGVMSCTSCHDPHSGERILLRSEVERCGSCHQAQRTPKAIVHPPVAEGCSTCHNPHGSPNRRLLHMAQPALCIQCHSIADNRHAVGGAARGSLSGAVLRRCVGCHKAIHGGHMDPHLRY
jgi:DmsE family decaheme c-type cytochrome